MLLFNYVNWLSACPDVSIELDRVLFICLFIYAFTTSIAIFLSLLHHFWSALTLLVLSTRWWAFPWLLCWSGVLSACICQNIFGISGISAPAKTQGIIQTWLDMNVLVITVVLQHYSFVLCDDVTFINSSKQPKSQPTVNGHRPRNLGRPSWQQI